MKPVLFHVLGFPVYSYSAFIVLAYALSLTYGIIAAKKLGYEPVHVIDVSMVIFVCGIVGARLLFVIIAHKRFADSPLDVLKIWQGGLVWYGGLLGAVAGAMLFLKFKKLPLWEWADLLAPSAMTTLFMGRIGCFLNGCCYGRIAPDLPWGVTYPMAHPAHGLHQTPVHPAPLYESLAVMLIFIVLVPMLVKKRFQGQVFWSMVLLYSIARFVIEFYRADPRGTILWFSTSQAVGIVGVVLAVAFMLLLRDARPVSPKPAEEAP